MKLALRAAWKYRGATSPNPPVGAVALDRQGNVLGVEAHQKAGESHAEIRLFRSLAQNGLANQIHTLVVTLEPCSHQGATAPCTTATIEMGVKEVIVGTRDPNPLVNGKGIECLRNAGIVVHEGILRTRCNELIAPFAHWIRTGRPWVTLKTAFRPDGSMIPDKGKKTFTSFESLRFAHTLRRRADALLTGSGTVLSDFPKFTIRHVTDFTDKQRWLIVLDRRGQVAEQSWLEEAQKNGFLLRTDFEGIIPALDFLGSKGCLEVLVEAGPTLTGSILNRGLWNEHVIIQKLNESSSDDDSSSDRIEIRYKHKEGTPPVGPSPDQLVGI